VKHGKEKMPKFISIPVRQMTLDSQNREQVRKLIGMADAKFRLSAKAWEDGNNSGNAETLAAMNKRERRLAREGEALLAPLAIKCDWPGLYPSFQVKGFTEYTTEAAVLAALGHPRNWLKEGKR
jgi:hypothetical protein